MKTRIFPRCKIDVLQDFVSADGYVMPCCWVADAPSMPDYLEMYKDCLPEMSTLNRPMDDIMADPRYLRVEQSWGSAQPFPTCVRQCGQPVDENHDRQYGMDEAVWVPLERKS